MRLAQTNTLGAIFLPGMMLGSSRTRQRIQRRYRHTALVLLAESYPSDQEPSRRGWQTCMSDFSAHPLPGAV